MGVFSKNQAIELSRGKEVRQIGFDGVRWWCDKLLCNWSDELLITSCSLKDCMGMHSGRIASVASEGFWKFHLLAHLAFDTSMSVLVSRACEQHGSHFQKSMLNHVGDLIRHHLITRALYTHRSIHSRSSFLKERVTPKAALAATRASTTKARKGEWTAKRISATTATATSTAQLASMLCRPRKADHSVISATIATRKTRTRVAKS